MPDPAVWQGRRVWLTGHTGFKGAWLALWLQSLGAEVHGFSSGLVSEPSLYEVADVADGMAGEVRGDVRSKSEVRAAVARARPDVVIHMAAQSLVRRGLSKPVESFTINVTGTAKVLEAVRVEAEPRAVVVVTSDKCVPQRRPRRGVPRGRPARRQRSLLGLEGRAGARRRRVPRARAADRDGARRQRDRRRRLGGRPAAARLHARGAGRRAGVAAGTRRSAPVAARAVRARRLPARGGGAARGRAGRGVGVELRSGRRGCPPRRLAGRARRGALAGRAAKSAPRTSRGEAPALRLDSTRARERLGWAPRWDLEAAIDATVAWYAAYRDGADMRAETRRQLAAYEV